MKRNPIAAGAQSMVQIDEMNDAESRKLLARLNYGHLGLVRETHPYVVPIHYAYHQPHVYIFTTEGKKTSLIENNAEICLQIEEVIDDKHWQSVIVTGDAVQLTDEEEVEQAMKYILAKNPALTPALGIRWMDQWVRENIRIVYRVMPETISGRMTIDRSLRQDTQAQGD